MRGEDVAFGIEWTLPINREAAQDVWTSKTWDWQQQSGQQQAEKSDAAGLSSDGNAGQWFYFCSHDHIITT